MIAHASVPVSNYAKSKELYTKMLAPLDYVLQMDMEEYKVGGFAHNGQADFWIGEKDTPSPGVHVAFMAANKEEVDAFHAKALEAGATDNGAPGIRTEYSPGYYAAFVLDFDGNNIEAVWMDLPG